MNAEQLNDSTQALVDDLMLRVEGCTLTHAVVRAMLGLAYSQGRADQLSESIGKHFGSDHAQP